MLFNIEGHEIDGNYESWKYTGQETARDRLAPGRGRSFPHPMGKTVFVGAVQIMHTFVFIFHIFFKKKPVNTLIEDIFLSSMILWDLC